MGLTTFTFYCIELVFVSVDFFAFCNCDVVVVCVCECQEQGQDQRAPWISMEDTVFSDDDSEVNAVTCLLYTSPSPRDS